MSWLWGLAYSNWDFGFGSSHWVWLGGVFYGLPRAGGWVSIMPWDLDALILMVGGSARGR